MNVAQTVQVFKYLMQGPLSQLELARHTSACPRSIGRLLREMRAQGLIYVLGYTNETDGRNRVKIYTVGDGADAKPKRTQSQQDRSRRSYLKKLQNRNASTPVTTFVGGKGLWQR